MAKKTRAEMETLIRRAADETAWEVFSEDPKVVRKMTRLYGVGEAKGQGMVWRVPPTGVCLKKPAQKRGFGRFPGKVEGEAGGVEES